MGIKLYGIICALLATSLGQAETSIKDFVNYASLDHKLSVGELRAGNHNPSGINNYSFRFKVISLSTIQSERKLEFEKRKKIALNAVEMGSIKITSLSLWDKKSQKAPEGSIKGETIRDLVSRSMRSFGVTELEIAILIEVEMYESTKTLGFFGDETLVGKTSYFLIPETFPHKPVTKDITLSIGDNLGTKVHFGVNFDLNRAEGGISEEGQ